MHSNTGDRSGLPGRYMLRLGRLALGTTVTALGVALMVCADIGLEPWGVFHQGMVNTLGVSFGMATIVTGALAVIGAAIMREPLGFGSLINIVLCGVEIDVITESGLIPATGSLLQSVAYILGGMLLLAVGTWLYMSAGLGAGPRDALTVAIVRKTGISVGVCRTAMEGTVMLAGMLMGGRLGLGTVIAVAGYGFLLDRCFRLLRFHPEKCRQESISETLRILMGKETAETDTAAAGADEA